MVRFLNYLTVKVRQGYFIIKKDLLKIFIKFFYINFKNKKTHAILKKNKTNSLK